MLLLAVLPLLLVRAQDAGARAAWWWVLAVPLGIAIAATPGLAGHAATGTFTQLAVPLDTLHVARDEHLARRPRGARRSS